MMGDADYSGSGVSYGLGLEYILNNYLSFYTEYVYRTVEFEQTFAVFYEESIPPEALSGDSQIFKLGVKFHIPISIY